MKWEREKNVEREWGREGGREGERWEEGGGKEERKKGKGEHIQSTACTLTPFLFFLLLIKH